MQQGSYPIGTRTINLTTDTATGVVTGATCDIPLNKLAQAIQTFLNLGTPIAVAYGGTGASTALTARANLGAAASGANSDITSLTGLTTPLSVSQGGTGATTLTAHGVLLGEGSGAIVATGTGTAGQALISAGASADPAYGVLGVSGGGTGATSAGATAANNIGALAIASNLSDLNSASTARTNLGLGTIATQNSNAVSITGGSISGVAVSGYSLTLDSISALRSTNHNTYTRVFVTGYYAAGDGGGGEYWYDPSDTTSSDNGGTIIVDSSNGRWKLVFTTTLSVKQWGAKVDGTTDDTSAISSAITWAKANNHPRFTIPSGTMRVSTIDMRGYYGGFYGNGINSTTIKANSAVTDFINLNETADVNPSSFLLSSLTVDGNSQVTNGINVRYRHSYLMENIQIINATNGVVEKDTYLSRHHNTRARACTTGWTLVGSNHASTFTGCTFDQNTGVQLVIQSNGTANDGNSGLVFSGCDIEFGSGSGNSGVTISATDVTFVGCYLGENISNNVISVSQGVVNISGGTLFYGYTGASFGITVAGSQARVNVRNASLAGQSFAGIQFLAQQSGSGSVGFYDCNYNGLVGGSPAMVGDPLAYGPQGTVYAPRLGKNWTGQGNNVTFSSAITGNQQTWTVLTAPGPTPLLGARGSLSGNSGWRDGETLYLVIIYQSSKPIDVRISAGAFGVAPSKIVQGSLPATTGSFVTGIGFQTTADAAAYTILEAVQQSSTVGDFLTISEVFLADSRMLNKLGAQMGNLYKC